MYASCGVLWLAWQVFEDLPIRDIVSWTALISGHEQHASALIDAYSRSGSKKDAQSVFQKLLKGDTAAWNTIIDGQGQHCPDALEYFEQMNLSAVMVDSMTFVGVLAACNHAGLVDEGLLYFEYMQMIEGIRPSAEHYACMVDMLSRAGRLKAALNFLQKLPFEPRLSLLTSVLSACRVHLNVDVAKTAAESMIRIEPQQESAFVLLSNIYALVEQFELGTIG